MGILSFINKRLPRDYSSFKEERMGSLEFPERLTNANAYRLAGTVAEIYWAIDFLADRVSKLDFYIGNKDGERKDNSPSNRLLTQTNPFHTFNDLVYQALFSMIADGQAYIWPQAPGLLGGLVTPNNITRTDVIQPTRISIREYTQVSIYDISKYSDLIAEAWLDTGAIPKQMTREEIQNLHIAKLDGTIRDSSRFLSSTPLYRAIRPINNLLAVYSARYNTYVNNGMAGILYKKSKGGTGAESLEGAVNGVSGNRQKIVDDITTRNGLTGRRNLIAVTDVDVAFINTLASIKDLMPMEETLENTIKIASIFQIPAGLVPRKDGQTFDNQDVQERSVWENTLMSMTDLVCGAFTKAWRLKDEKVCADYSSVSCLSENAIEREDLKGKQLDNLTKINTILSTENVKPEVAKIATQMIQDYEEGQ